MDQKRQKMTPGNNDVQKECQDAKMTALERKLEYMENKLKLNDVQRECQDAKIMALERKLEHMENKLKLIMNNRYLQTPGMNPPPRIPRDYPYRPTPMPTSNPLYSSGAGFAPNMPASPYSSTPVTSENHSNSSYPSSSSPYPSTPVTSENHSNSSYPSSSSPYLLTPNNIYPVSTSPYPASSNKPHPASSSYPANYNSLYPASALPYLASSTKYYPASGSPYHASSNSHYPTSSNSPYPAATSVHPGSSNRHYPASNSSYPRPTSRTRPPGASPHPSMESRGYDSKFGPSVNKSIDGALNINYLPDEIILKVFGYLMHNQLCQIAGVCRRWNALTKSPLLWKKVNVKIMPCHGLQTQIDKSLFDRLPSSVTSIRFDFAEFEDWIELNFVNFCEKLQQKCPHLEELILSDSKLSNSLPSVIDLCIQFFVDVKNLVFHSCIFPSYSSRREFAGTSKIEVLDLSHSLFGLFDTPSYSKMPYLKQLLLPDTNVDDSWFEDDISFLNQLHVLDVGYTYFTSSMFSVIRDNGLNLKELFLCNIRVLDGDLSFNTSVFPHLETICLRGCPNVTCKGVVSLIQTCQSLQNVYVDEGMAALYAAHPFTVANECKLEIVKIIPDCDDHQRNAY